MANFIDETEYLIKKYFGEDYEVDELRITFDCFNYTDEYDDLQPETQVLDDDMPYQSAYIQKGGKIDWVKMSQYFGVDLKTYDYDDGYGTQEFDGWITFKNSNKWLVRHEYDGMESWSIEKKPSLEDYKDGLQNQK
jgi:hypothetical protein